MSQEPQIKILHGDCLDLMRDLPDNSVDSVVTDPPYGLSKEPDMAEVLRHWLAGDDYAHKGSGFMGKSWDSFVPGPTIWKEAFRVLKPGGHLLAFAGSRTQDLMGMAIRLAGFENRDCIMWVFGSGFPKSANVSKMIDKQAGAEREVVGQRKKLQSYGANNVYGDGPDKDGVQDITAPATEAAKQWNGFGTALKPAYEPCLMFRKPLAKGNTVAANVLEHGTGAINVDGCRVGTESITVKGGSKSGNGFAFCANYKEVNQTNTGRFPANLIHDGSQEVIDLFPVTGASKSGGVGQSDPGMWSGKKQADRGGHDDNGGSAARFFYQAKASKRDRDEGCEGMEEVRRGAMAGNVDDGDFLTGSGNPRRSTGRNNHPTVKPTDLMRYLVRLVTPPGGTVLDPFMGSGSTGKAAVLEGFNFIGCELDAEYIEITKARIRAVV